MVVAAIDVGRVIVDDIMYEIVPRSNYFMLISMHSLISFPARTHINTRGQPLAGELELKVELIDPRFQPAFAAQGDFILEERGVPVTKILRLAWVTANRNGGIHGWGIVRTTWVLEDPYKSVQANREMRDANGLDDREDDGALDQITRGVLSMGIAGADVEVG